MCQTEADTDIKYGIVIFQVVQVGSCMEYVKPGMPHCHERSFDEPRLGFLGFRVDEYSVSTSNLDTRS